MARNNIYGKAKQGLGIALVIDGQQFPAAWKPASMNFNTATVDVTHAQTENFKAEVIAELAEAMTMTGEFFFDPQLKPLVELMRTSGRQQERDIYIMFPQSSTAQGTTHENGYVRMPAGTIGVGTITADLEGPMTAEFTIAGGTTNVEINIQQEKSNNVPTAVVVTPASNLTSASILEDDVIGTLTSTGGDQYGPAIFFDLADTTGTAVVDGDIYLEGQFIKAGIDGAGGAGALDIEVSTGGWRAWTQETTADLLEAEPCDITLV